MKKSAPDIDVAYVANLARLDLSAEETALFQDQLGDVLKYVAILNEVRVDESLDAVPAITSDLRPDEPRDWFTAEEALRNAPRQRDHLFIVPKVVE
jgi:aspartyl-tRNA(Asn)/glutamyl-tRNA(Gln) amidotransferase subunit C